MTGFQYTPETGTLTINSVSMNSPAWAMVDLMPLWTPGGVRGGNIIVPGAQGTVPRKRRFDEARHSLPMALTGECDHAGTPASSTRFAQLQANIAYLYDHIVTAGTSNLTYPASLTMPDGTTRTADIQVDGIVPADHDLDLVTRATLEIIIPAGRFA